jgi:hypothetical protein
MKNWGQRKIYGLSTKTPTGVSWSFMRMRCYNPKREDYKYYGARGVKVCSYILGGPDKIVELIGERSPKMTIDRIETNGHYSCGTCGECLANKWPMNIRWADAKTQRINQRRTELVTIEGETKPCSEWVKETGMPFMTFYARIRRGWKGARLLGPREINQFT